MSLLDLRRWAYPVFTGWSREAVRPPATPVELLWEFLHRRRLYASAGVRGLERIGFHVLWLLQRVAYNAGWLRGL